MPADTILIAYSFREQTVRGTDVLFIEVNLPRRCDNSGPTQPPRWDEYDGVHWLRDGYASVLLATRIYHNAQNAPLEVPASGGRY